jgi:hypothetical protein
MAEASIGRGLRLLPIVIEPLADLAEQAPSIGTLSLGGDQFGS